MQRDLQSRLRIPHRLTEFYKQAPSCETYNIKLPFIRFLDFRFIKINNRIEAIEMKYLSHTLVIDQVRSQFPTIDTNRINNIHALP